MLVELNVVVILFCEKDRLIAGVYGHLLGDARYLQFHAEGPKCRGTHGDGYLRVLEAGSVYTQHVLAHRNIFECKSTLLVGRRGEGLPSPCLGQRNTGIRHNRTVGALDDSPHGSCVLSCRFHGKYGRQENKSAEVSLDHWSSRLSSE